MAHGFLKWRTKIWHVRPFREILELVEICTEEDSKLICNISLITRLIYYVKLPCEVEATHLFLVFDHLYTGTQLHKCEAIWWFLPLIIHCGKSIVKTCGLLCRKSLMCKTASAQNIFLKNWSSIRNSLFFQVQILCTLNAQSLYFACAFGACKHYLK